MFYIVPPSTPHIHLSLRRGRFFLYLLTLWIETEDKSYISTNLLESFAHFERFFSFHFFLRGNFVLFYIISHTAWALIIRDGWMGGKEWNSTRYSTDTNDLIINTAVGRVSYFFFMFRISFNYLISRDLLANIS